MNARCTGSAPDIEKKLRLRIKAIEAAETLGDLSKNDPFGRWHRLSGGREGQWAGKVSGNERIIIEPSCAGVKVLDVIEQLTVSEVIVREITDYHD